MAGEKREFMPSAVVADHLSKEYLMGKVRVRALDNVSLTVAEGEMVGISGSSGSGKSTLLNLLAGLDRPSSGEIKIMGESISGMSADELALYRRFGVGMIFQSFNLVPALTAWENVALPLLFAGVTKGERRERANTLLQRVGLGDRSGHRPSELSGGEQQRVAIARSLVNQPRLLLADEPTGNLDSHTSREIAILLQELNKEAGITVLLVSHEFDLLQEFTDYSVCLVDGRTVQPEGGTG